MIQNLIRCLCIMSYWGVYLLGMYDDLDLLVVAVIISTIGIVEVSILEVMTILSVKKEHQ